MRAFIICFLFFYSIISNAQESLIADNSQASTCFQKVSGEIRDRKTNDLIPNTVVSLLDNQGNPIETQMVLENAKFSFTVNCEKVYKLTASKETYTSESKEFSTTKNSGIQMRTKIFLDKGSIDFITESKAIETDITKTELSTNNKLESLDLQQQPIINQPKDEIIEKAKKVVEKKEVSNKKTNDISKIKTVKNNENKDVLVLKPVLFDYESSYLNKEAKIALKKVVNIMKGNPSIILECASYTDAKGTEEYNMWMSKRRAKRTVDYIVSRGISRSRISGKGFGETKLLNHCKDNIECSDQERALNRRTEFIIVKM